MKLLSTIAGVVGVSLLGFVAPVLAALPTVNTFTVAATALSPVPVTAFTASDSDGTVVGYMITQTSGKPSASDSRWTSTRWTSFTTTSTGSLTLYAWAKDNANGVSNSRSAATNVLGGHVHTIAQVTGLTAALAGKADLSHNHDGMYAKKHAKLVVVSTDGNGDFTSPVAAMDAIVDANAANPYLVKIMPGVYDIGTGVVQMKEYVDIEGSGESVTKITGNVSMNYFEGTNEVFAVVMGANNAELRSLTVENAGPGPLNMSIAIANVDTSPRITHVTVLATNGANWTEGIWNHGYASPTLTNLTIQVAGTARSSQGIVNIYGTPVIRNTTIVSTGVGGEIYGIYNADTGLVKVSDTTITVTGGSWRNMGIHNSWHSALELSNVTISSPGPVGEAIWSYGTSGAMVTVNRSTLEGGVNAIASAGGYNVKVGASQLIGAVIGDPSVCVGAYDGNFNPLNAACQP